MPNDKIEDLGSLPNGCNLWRKPNQVGGHVYTTDEVGGGAVVWDTCIVDQSTLLAAITEESRRKLQEFHRERKLKHTTKPYNTGQVHEGYIILLREDDCSAIDCPAGRYVVEEAEFRGGWFVSARLLGKNDVYDPSECHIDFYQDAGYVRHLSIVRVVGKMKKIFI